MFFSHSQLVSVTLVFTVPVSGVIVVVVVLNFFTFSISFLKLLHVFASNFVWMFLGWVPTTFVKIWLLSVSLFSLKL